MFNNILYRVVREDEVVNEDGDLDFRPLVARAPSAEVTIDEHVRKGSIASQYISTCKSLSAAEAFALGKEMNLPPKGGRVIVAIDHQKLQQLCREQRLQHQLHLCQQQSIEYQHVGLHYVGANIEHQLEAIKNQLEKERNQLQLQLDVANRVIEGPYNCDLTCQQLKKNLDFIDYRLEKLKDQDWPLLRIIDLNNYKFDNDMAINYANKFEEVLIIGEVPAACWSLYKRVYKQTTKPV